MSQLTDQMNAAIANLQATHGVTTDQVNAIVSQATAPLQAQIAQIMASEGDDATKIADVTAAVTEFTNAFAPTNAASTPAPAPVPTTDATAS